jgi:hypothetical protein
VTPVNIRRRNVMSGKWKCPECNKITDIGVLSHKQTPFDPPFQCKCGYKLKDDEKNHIVNKIKKRLFVSINVAPIIISGVSLGLAKVFYKSIGFIFLLIGIYWF